MANLKTRYMGLELKNPIIVGANNMVTNPDGLKRMEDAGASAVVYKSLFEEQIQMKNLEDYERTTEYEDRHAEMITLFPDPKPDSSYQDEHLLNLRKAKESVSIPVFGSLNARHSETWVEYAKKIEEAGVDGIELNFYTVPEKFNNDENHLEEKQTEILKLVKNSVKIPVAVKLSSFYSNPLQIIAMLDNSGANGFVLFNRLFQPDIDTDTEQIKFPYNLSNGEDHRLPLRFAGLLHGHTKGSMCANTGIFSGNDVVKMILAGADCVQVVSTLYLNQIETISTMLTDIEKWMDNRGYKSLSEFKGKLSRKNSEDKNTYHRAQYLDFILSTSEILKKYKVIN